MEFGSGVMKSSSPSSSSLERCSLVGKQILSGQIRTRPFNTGENSQSSLFYVLTQGGYMQQYIEFVGVL
jgi:hypothetical protein